MESNPTTHPEGYETRAEIEQLAAKVIDHIEEPNLDKLLVAYEKLEESYINAFHHLQLKPSETFLPLISLAERAEKLAIGSGATTAAGWYSLRQRIYGLLAKPVNE